MTRSNILSIVVALALVAALAVGATLAFFSDNDTAANTFTMGKVDINLDESNDGGQSWVEDGLEFEGLVPGDTTPKMARITVAEDSNDCYLAVTVALECKDFDDATGKGFTAGEKEKLMEAVVEAINPDEWTVTPQDDGSLLCVYKEARTAEDEVILFKEITLPLGSKTEFGNNLAEESFSLVLNAYAVQADNITLAEFDWYNDLINVTEPTPEPTAEPVV